MADAVWIEVGFVASTHGVRGALVVRWHDGVAPCTPLPPELQLKPRGGAPKLVTIAQQRLHKTDSLLQLHQIADLNAALPFKGATVLIEERCLPEEAEGEVYLYRLMGAECRDEHGHVLGTLRNIYDHGASIVLGIARSRHGSAVAVAKRAEADDDELLVPLLDTTLRHREQRSCGTQVLTLALLPDAIS